VKLSQVADKMETGLNGFKQVTGTLVVFEDDQYNDEGRLKRGAEPFGVCALGALALGNGRSARTLDDTTEDTYWPSGTRRVLPKDVTSCPAATVTCYSWSGSNGQLPNAVIHLNDNHKWTIKQIADWLRSLDQEPAAAAA
jgi:hypothetical protein